VTERERPTPGYAIVGRVRKAHGVRGELVVEPYTSAPEVMFASGARVVAGTVDGEVADGAPTLTVRKSSPFKGGLIVAFAEIADRNAAELWRERYVLVPTDELTPPGDDEVFQHELIGMRVERLGGEAVGTVAALYELPQGVMLEVGEGRGSVLVPYRAEVVRRVDVEARVIVIEPPDGLLE
jgi:16S rRNA processing protein RimM